MSQHQGDDASLFVPQDTVASDDRLSDELNAIRELREETERDDNASQTDDFFDSTDSEMEDVQDSETENLPTVSDIKHKNATLELAREYPWSEEGLRSEERQIEVQEEALDKGICSGKMVVDILEKTADPKLREEYLGWIDDFKKICKDHEQFSVRVGFSGATGVGKTSLLDALLDHFELLPSGSQGASTGTVCVVHENKDPRPSQRFHAVVKFRTLAAVQNWLEILLQDLHDAGASNMNGSSGGPTENINSDFESDSDSKMEHHRYDSDPGSLDDVFAPIYAVWKYTEDELRSMTAADILESNGDVKKLLSTTRRISHSELERFSEKLKPYVDSTSLPDDVAGGDVEIWPLMERVDLYVTADILKNGVVLEDLPGLGDNVEMRAKVAQDRFNKLDVVLIVSPVIRASDEATAAKLISENQAMRMRLDNKLNKRSFCVVTSKTDEMNWMTHMDKTMKPAADSDLGRKRAMLKSLQDRFRRTGEKLTQKKELLRELSAECTVLQATQDKPLDFQELQQARQAHKNLEAEITRLAQMQDRIRKLKEFCIDELTYYCIQARNGVVHRKIQEAFKRKKLRLEAQKAKKAAKNKGVRTAPATEDADGNDDMISVLPASAGAYWSAKLYPDVTFAVGFPEENYSGVPALREWVRRAAIPARKAHVEALLRRLHVLLEFMATAFKDSQTGLLTIDKPEIFLGNLLGTFQTVLLKNLQRPADELAERVRLCNPLQIPSQKVAPPSTKQSNRKFHPECRKAVLEKIKHWEAWDPRSEGEEAKPRMHWMTQGAIIRRKGDRYKSRGLEPRTYTWMEDIATIILEDITGLWRDAFHRRLPQVAIFAGEDISTVWSTSLRNIREQLPKLFPDQHAYLLQQLDAINAIRDYVINRIQNEIHEITKKARDVHPKVRGVLDQRWSKTFDKARRFHGKGVMTRRQQSFDSFAYRNIQKQIKEAVEKMQTEIKTNMDHFEQVMPQIWADGMAKIKAQLGAMVRTLTEAQKAGAIEEATGGSDDDNNDAKEDGSCVPVTRSMAELRTAVNRHLVKWETDWTHPNVLMHMPAEASSTAIPTEYTVEPDDDWLEALSDSGSSDGLPSPKAPKPASKRKKSGEARGQALKRKKGKAAAAVNEPEAELVETDASDVA